MNARSLVLTLLACSSFAALEGCRRKVTPAATPVPSGADAAAAQRRADADAAAQRRADSISAANAAASRDAAGDRQAQLDMANILAQRVYFDYDRDQLRDDGAAVLDAKSAVLQANPSITLVVTGHTDERGTAEYNLALGEKRALAAKTYMVSLGVPADRLRTVSYGKEFPFDPGHDEGAWSKNRRAHFVVTSK